MFYIIENKSQLDTLLNSGDCFVQFIPVNYNIHPQLNSLSLVYIRYINDHKGYILCIKHNESFSLEKDDVIEYLRKKANKLFVLNKKESMYYFPFSHKLFDINFISTEDNIVYNKCIDWFYKNVKYKDINCLIPISKHYEYCEQLYKLVINKINKYDESDLKYQFNNISLTETFYKIENKGIKLDKDKFINYYLESSSNPEYNISKGLIYTSYNLYTLTGRPSNSFNNINFNALSKTNGERECLIPRNDIFVEIDYDGYHPRLIAELIDYKFTDESVHNQLGKLYGNVDYQKSKEITFQQLYGGIRKEYQDNPYFSKVSEYINNIWNEINEKGFIETINKRFELSKIENPNPQKVFNYIIQNLETTNNVIILEQLQKYLKYKQTKIVLYNYDAILFDVKLSDGNDIINQIQKIMKYPSKVKLGNNFNNLQKK